jgi:uncharacterized membrane protein/thiol-disulfide isomerase/thioredoxin
MMKRIIGQRSIAIGLLTFAIISILFPTSLAFGQQPVIRAVLFYSPTCPNCHIVIDEVLPPLVEQYPDQLDIVGIDVSHPVGGNLYQTAIAKFNIPTDRLGVPTLIVGQEVLVGSYEIPEKFPAIIQAGLAGGGIDWPAIPDLNRILAAQENGQPGTMLSTASQAPASNGKPEFVSRFLRDPLANSISVIVLIGMLASCLIVLINYLQGPERKFISSPAWVIPVLAIIGAAVAFYLSYIEISNTEAVCGPVGNCNSVQQSPYAKLFGLLPIGALGFVGYAAILVSWLLQTYGPHSRRKFFTIAVWGMAWLGMFFSIYLTFLEPFVIGATCAWCITSALVMTAIFLLSTQPAKEAMQVTMEDEDEDEPDQEQEVNQPAV